MAVHRIAHNFSVRREEDFGIALSQFFETMGQSPPITEETVIIRCLSPFLKTV